MTVIFVKILKCIFFYSVSELFLTFPLLKHSVSGSVEESTLPKSDQFVKENNF